MFHLFWNYNYDNLLMEARKCYMLLIAILAGVSIVVARIINANLAKEIGNWEGTFLIILLDYFSLYYF